MQLGPVTKLDQRNNTTSKKTDDDVMLKNWEAFVILGIFGQFRAVGGRIPDTEFAKFMFSLIVTFCLTKTENKNKNSLIQLSHYCFE